MIQQSLAAIGVSQSTSERWINELSAAHRHYHGLPHIVSILRYYNAIGGTDPAIMAAAWLHDICYDVRRTDNEEMSAEVARQDLAETDMDIPLVVELILGTRTHEEGPTPTHDLFNDLDLLVLAGDDATYMDYAKAIRREYSFAPLDQYAARRTQVLRGFDRKTIFHSRYFKDREKAAHSNLQREITLLEKSPTLIEW